MRNAETVLGVLRERGKRVSIQGFSADSGERVTRHAVRGA